MKKTILTLVLACVALVFSCKQVHSPKAENKPINKLAEIQQSGVLRVVTDYNSTSYFVYRGQPMGFQFALLEDLAEHLGVKLEVIANNKLQEKFTMLHNDDVDLIAVNLTVTRDRKKFLSFTEPHTQTRQVLIQRKPVEWREMTNNALEAGLIRKQLDLGGKEVYVQKNSAYARRLKNLAEEIGDTIIIKEVDAGVEELIQKVSNGEIEYTVADENVALINQTYLSNLDIETPVSFYQNLAWAVNTEDIDLKKVIDDWMIDFKQTRRFSHIYNRYFRSSRYTKIVDSDYYTLNSGNISPYDNSIKRLSETINWDWRLVASMIFQESRFNPKAKSWAGAFGIMQLMPRTANRFGVDQQSSVEQQMLAGIRFIAWLNKQLTFIEDIEERKKFVLASYNVGLGHVLDAMALAEGMDKNPHIWTGSVDECLLLKANPKYHSYPGVKYGYCRGTETYNYVAEIVTRYDHYKNLVIE